MSWIPRIISSTKRLETPESFWYWSFLSALSAIVKDNVYFERDGAFKSYPNIYVMLLARSGLKKGLPVRFAKDLVKAAGNTHIISGRSSIQGILKELGTAYTTESGQVITKSVGYVIASEFSSSLVEDKAAMTILTDLFDRHWNEGDWKSLLKMESFHLKDPILSMLVATNSPHFKEFVPEKDVMGGFIGRMFVIAEDKPRCRNALIRKTDLFELFNKLRKEMNDYVLEIAKLKGEFTATDEALDRYESWYEEFYEAIDRSDKVDDTGTVERFGDSVLKVAMLIALSKKPELVLDRCSLDEAITACERLVGNVRKVTMGKGGKSSLAYQKTLILQELLDRPEHKVTREQLLKKHWMHFSHEELDMMISSFTEAGLVATETHGYTVEYVMPEAVAEDIKAFLEGRKND